ncbi:Uu.00g114860.m01.CDS01 [Anthostomella pinea]|uniref:Uu.00g114860.m01.CDS01 n=1 Tax=Anthostomella pinea TaxID=933095 RepID=A0AAI8VFT0_9PEZI|nr:Uu.00g114860.m01.CDS01 [Anthostomella pinea]
MATSLPIAASHIARQMASGDVPFSVIAPILHGRLIAIAGVCSDKTNPQWVKYQVLVQFKPCEVQEPAPYVLSPSSITKPVDMEAIKALMNSQHSELTLRDVIHAGRKGFGQSYNLRASRLKAVVKWKSGDVCLGPDMVADMVAGMGEERRFLILYAFATIELSIAELRQCMAVVPPLRAEELGRLWANLQVPAPEPGSWYTTHAVPDLSIDPVRRFAEIREYDPSERALLAWIREELELKDQQLTVIQEQLELKDQQLTDIQWQLAQKNEQLVQKDEQLTKKNDPLGDREWDSEWQLAELARKLELAESLIRRQNEQLELNRRSHEAVEQPQEDLIDLYSD